MIGKQKLLLFATILLSFSELPVKPFSRLPIPLLYDTSTLRLSKREVNEVLDLLAVIADDSDFSTNSEEKELVKSALTHVHVTYAVSILVPLQVNGDPVLCKGINGREKAKDI